MIVEDWHLCFKLWRISLKGVPEKCRNRIRKAGTGLNLDVRPHHSAQGSRAMDACF